jgi:hypothetical protein
VGEYARAGRLKLVLEEFRPSLRLVPLYDRQNRFPLKLRAFVDFGVPRLRVQLERAVL